MAAQAHGRVKPIPKIARDSGLGAVGVQDGLCSNWTRTGDGVRYLRSGQEKRPGVYESCTRRALCEIRLR